MFDQFKKIKVLVIGCGGLGNEVIKELIHLNVKHIDIVDNDIIEISNLHRQFFFNEYDIGKYKCDIICKILSNIEDLKILGHIKKIQSFELNFFENFDFIIGCLDNIEGRLYLNNIIYKLKNNVIYIDGAVEGFKGSIKIIKSHNKFACFNCTLKNFTNETYPICSIINQPKNAEDCIIYVMNIEFQNKMNETLNTNCDKHINWIYNEAKKRAKKFNIDNVTYNLTKQIVTSNIIPTVISTLMIITSYIIKEFYDFVINKNIKKNYSDIYYCGDKGFYTFYYGIEKLPECIICNNDKISLILKKTDTLKTLVNYIKEKYNCKKISISSNIIIYISSPYFKKYEHKLDTTFKQLIDEKQIYENNTLDIQTELNSLIIYLKLE